jgi:CSLREA domain-containing protein
MAHHPSLHSARLVLVAATIVACPRLAIGATFAVNSTADAVDALPGNGVCATAGGVCTLRAAIQETRALGGAHVITLPAGIYVFTIAGRGEINNATGDLNLIADLTINGFCNASSACLCRVMSLAAP